MEGDPRLSATWSAASVSCWGRPNTAAIGGATKLLARNLTQGTSTDASEAYVGDFTKLLIGVRTELALEISREAADGTGSAFGNLQVWVRCYMRADVAVMRPTAFGVVTGVR